MFLPVELEIELFCRGMRVDPESHIGEVARRIARTRAGLGSGLEIIVPSPRKDIWVNVPVVEPFAEKSPFLLQAENGGYAVVDERTDDAYPVKIPEEPEWYSRKTTGGTEMSRIGVLQGNYLGIYVSNRCLYWALTPAAACKFCTTGKNVGVEEESRKSVDDVVEVALAAQQESGSIFTHLNTGYHFEEDDSKEKIHGLKQCEPYVQAIRERVGGFIGVQAVPVPEHRFWQYDQLIASGVDHFSFCYEFEDPDFFAILCPGKEQSVGQEAFFKAMEYTSSKLGKGRVSGEIIAGIEPLEATKKGIDRIVDAGAFPTVCIFRPTLGSDMEHVPPPEPAAMIEIFAYLYEACKRGGIPVGVLPIEVSLIVQPEETVDLVNGGLSTSVYEMKNWAMRQLAKPYVAWKQRPTVRSASQ